MERSTNFLFVCRYHCLEVLLSAALFVVVDTAVLLWETMKRTECVPYRWKRNTKYVNIEILLQYTPQRVHVMYYNITGRYTTIGSVLMWV